VNWLTQGTLLVASRTGNDSLLATTHRTVGASMPAALAKAGNKALTAPPAGSAIALPSRSLSFLRPESSRQKIACGGLRQTMATSSTGIWSLARANIRVMGRFERPCLDILPD
jgi:hypothetical protein